MSNRSRVVGLLLLGGFAFSVVGFYRTLPTAINPSNVEGQIRSWISSFGYGYHSVPHGEVYFALQIDLPTGRHITVIREKNPPFDRYVTLETPITLAPEHRDKLAKEPAARAKLGLDLAIVLIPAKAISGSDRMAIKSERSDAGDFILQD